MRKEKNPVGYPEHDPHEDIYQQDELRHLDSNEGKLVSDQEDLKKRSMTKEEELEDGLVIKDHSDDDWNEENFDEDHTGDDLDVPGSELDDAEESTGSEDEENNVYSLGGPDKDE